MHDPQRLPEEASPLTSREKVWRDRYCMLESHGYRLRPRFSPDWTPSWIGTNKLPAMHEDYYHNDSSVTIDAVRILDGRRVFLKRVVTRGREFSILRYLSDEEKLRDPHNHTVPLLDAFLDDENEKYTFIVLPLLHPYFHPDFFSVDEVLDFMRQLLEGLVYMHKLNIAHRDCSELNIMMDADKMFPRGFHPTISVAEASPRIRLAKPRRRRDVSYVRYYYIDFGISVKFDHDDDDKRVFGVIGQDDEVPELSQTEPYDPFFVDVFILGNLFKKTFLERYDNLDFLKPLINEMTAPDWLDRSDSIYALKAFNRIVSNQSRCTLRWRLKEKSSSRATRFLQDVDSASHETALIVKDSICELRSRFASVFRMLDHSPFSSRNRSQRRTIP
ncbi:hypothetical protein ACEPAI_4416 [Sanghuangporus weigelae]